MNQKELLILSQFRKNARENLTSASRNTRVPISTLYDRLRKYEGTVIRKHTALLDFGKIGYSLKVHMAIKVAPKHRVDLREFLLKHPRVNSLFTVSNGYDFLAELIFRNLFEVSVFSELLDKYTIVDKHEFYIVEDIKREDFLVESEFVDAGYEERT